MVTVMDDHAREIFDQARETLARTADVEVVHRSYDDDALTSWRRGMPTERPTTLADIDAKIAEHRAVWLEVQARAISHERQLHRAEVAKLREEFAEDLAALRSIVADIRNEHDLRISAVLHATEKLERGLGGDRGDVVELPSFIQRRRHG
jgi:hypothetical protein